MNVFMHMLITIVYDYDQEDPTTLLVISMLIGIVNVQQVCYEIHYFH